MNDDDNQLITQSLHGDIEAFARLARRHGKAIHGYLSRRSSGETADDLLAEVWLRALRSRTTYDQCWTDARPWLYGIARNTLRSHWRDAQRGSRRESEQPFDPWPDVDDSLDVQRSRKALQRGLSALQPEDREVLLLVAWEDLTPSEAAVTLGIPAGTARWRLHRARREFSAAFATAQRIAKSEPTTKEV